MTQYVLIAEMRECRTGESVFRTLIAVEADSVSEAIAHGADGMRSAMIQAHCAAQECEDAAAKAAAAILKTAKRA
jgi:hypothetical protein